MWVDHFSCFLHAQCHEQATIQSTLESKESFKLFAKWYNVWIKHIHSDNGVFTTKAFKDYVVACDQQQLFCGVSAHWQNGVIECYIGVITTCACTMLLHVMQMWPDLVNSEFWSYAFLYAVCLHNCTPRANETMSPFTLFTNKDMMTNPNDFKVFRITGLHSRSVFTVRISRPWKMEGEVISRCIHWTFATKEQCNPCIQS